MKKTTLIFLSLLVSCLITVPGTWANTQGYRDYAENTVTQKGVLGAEVLYPGDVAVHGVANASTVESIAGYFENLGRDGTGVFGNAAGEGAARGGEFWTFSPEGIGVVGRSLNGKGKTYGGWFRDISENGTAVHGEAGATTNTVTYGGHFESASTQGIGVYGFTKSKTGKTYGGHFLSDSTIGTGVYGAARALTGKTYGGYFRTSSADGSAVYGFARRDQQGRAGTGGEFITDGNYGTGVQGESKANSGYGVGGRFVSSGYRGAGAIGYANSSNGVNYGVKGMTDSPDGYGVYSQGNLGVDGTISCTGNQKIDGNQIVGKNLLVKGNQTVTGTKSAVVKRKNGEGITLYAVEASENWFEDFGSAKLKDGAAVVAIDPLYSETVNTEIDYHVFLTPRGECKGLYVINQKGSSFEVRELNGGKSDIPFSYRIVAKRKGYEDVRLAKVKEETLAAMTTVEDDVKKDEAIDGRRKVK